MAVKRGFFFTLDAIIAATIILGGIILCSSFGQLQSPVLHLNYMSNDLIGVLGDLQFYELGPEAYNIIANATEPVETNQSVLGVISELWATDELFIASNLAEFVIEGMLSPEYGIGIWMDNEQVYARTSPAPTTSASARKIISGISKSAPIKGVIARANALDLTRLTTRIISFSPQGSGWKGSVASPGIGVSDKYFTLDNNQTLLNASLAISMHMHQGQTNWTVVDINNGSCVVYRSEISSSGQGYYDTKDVTGCIQQGVNHIKVDMRNIDYNGHIHPGMLLLMNFSEPTTIPLYASQHNERIFFDNLTSIPGSGDDSGVWQVVPFHIPPNAMNVSAKLQIVGKGVNDYTAGGNFFSWAGLKKKKDYDYILFFNQNTPFDSDNTPITNPTYIYNSTELASSLVDGTNVAVVYFNNYGDSSWGDGNVSIYSDPVNDPDNSSYVDLNYTITSSLPYGHVEIRAFNESGGSEDDTKFVSFSFPQNSVMSEVYGHIAQRTSYEVKVEADTFNPPTTQVFSSPSSRAVPSDIFIPTTTLSGSPTATNFVEFTDLNNNKILPETSVEYRFHLPAFVGYGAVFPDAQSASDDAIARLEAILAPYITAGSFNVETGNMTGVPTLLGPTTAEVRIWR
jgi:hypothetical protein